MAPKRDAPPEEQLAGLFQKLASHIQSGQDKKVLKAADEVLKMDPQDPDALRCKVVAQLHQSHFEEALATISAFPADLAGDVAYEKGYALYRAGRYEEASAALADVPEDRAESKLKLQGQVLYRLGQMDKCADVYHDLVFTRKVTGLEITTNLVAAMVGSGASADVPSALKKAGHGAGESYELAFNTACGIIEEGALEDAEELLQLSQRVGKEALYEEDFTEEEVTEELAPVTAQLAYLASLMGRPEEALECLGALIKAKVDDEATMAVVASNMVAERGTKQIFDAMKHLDKLLDKGGDAGGRISFLPGLEARLSDRQKEAVGINRGLLLMHQNKLDAARKAASAVVARFPDSEHAGLLLASLDVREKKHTAAVEALMERAARGAGGTASLLASAQAAALGGAWRAATLALSSLDEPVRHKPGVVATVAALCEKDGDSEGAQGALDAALEYWGRAMDTGGSGVPALDALLAAAAKYKLARGDHRQAASLFERLLARGPGEEARQEALSGLVQACSQFDPAAAERYSKELPALPGADDVDVDMLERYAAAAAASARAAPGAEAAGEEEAAGGAAGKKGRDFKRKGGGEGDDRPKKPRKKKPKYPKGFDPANPGPPPDPERWIPKWERSKKKKKGRNEPVKGSQGAGKVNESLEMTKKAEPEPEKEPEPVAKKSGKKGKKGRK